MAMTNDGIDAASVVPAVTAESVRRPRRTADRAPRAMPRTVKSTAA